MSKKSMADKAQAKMKALEELKTLGREIAARVKVMKKYEQQAEEKAGFEMRKALEVRQALEEKMIPEAHAKCKAAGMSFKRFKAEYFPEISRTRLYEILAIADGRTTKAKLAEQQRTRDERKKPVREAPSPDTAQPASAGTAAIDATASARELEAKFEKMDQEPTSGAAPPGSPPEPVADAAVCCPETAAPRLTPAPPEPAVVGGRFDDTPEKKSKRVLAAGKSWLDDNLEHMVPADRAALFHYFKFHNAMIGVRRKAA